MYVRDKTPTTDPNQTYMRGFIAHIYKLGTIIMKTVLLSLFLLTYLSSFGQLPEIKTNVGEEIKLKSIVYDNLHLKYDFIISFNSQSYWSSKYYYQILAKKAENWDKITLVIKKNKKGNFLKPNIKKEKFSEQIAENLIAGLTSKSFWNLNRDSLNNDKVEDKKTGTIHKYSLSDGTDFRFEIIKNTEFLLIDAYEPEYYLKKIPEVISRKTFISCANLFINVLKE